MTVKTHHFNHLNQAIRMQDFFFRCFVCSIFNNLNFATLILLCYKIPVAYDIMYNNHSMFVKEIEVDMIV